MRFILLGGGGVRNHIDGELLPCDIYPGEGNPWGRKSHVTPCVWMCGQQNKNRAAVDYRDILMP